MSDRVRRLVGRFAVVGACVTLVDVTVFVLARRAGGLSLVGAAALAVGVAATTSYAAHRWLTFRGDPYARWVRRPGVVVGVVVVAGLVDVAVVVLLVGPRTTAVVPLVAGKLAALGVGASLRLVAFRRVLFGEVRRRSGAAPQRDPAAGAVRLSVVVPAYREEERIGATVDRVRRALAPVAADGGLEIVVVDDGSPDGTSAAARAAGADVVLRQEPNQGKGAAVRAGMIAATGRTIVFTDADLAYPPEQVLRVLDAVEAGWDVVVGSRRHVDTTTLVGARRIREIGGRVINLCTTAVLLGQYRDTQCGLKGFRSDVANLLFRQVRTTGFAFDIEVFHLAERYELGVLEVPVEVENSERSTVKVVRDGFRLLRDLVRIRRWAKTGAYASDPAVVWPLPLPGTPGRSR